MRKWKPFGKHGPSLKVGGIGTAADMEVTGFRSAAEMKVMKATSTPVHPELEALKAVMEEDSDLALTLIQDMTGKDRAVFAYWLRELSMMAEDATLAARDWRTT